MAKKEEFEEGNEYIIVKNSKVHGKGIFARNDLPKGTRVLEYVGKKITKKESDKIAEEQLERAMGNKEEGAVYIFELDDKYDIDGNVPWNTAKYINHSCDPNCETEDDGGRIWIITLKELKKGEELTYDYGYDLDNYEDHPCKCGSENCVGYIVAQKHRNKLKKKLSKKS